MYSSINCMKLVWSSMLYLSHLWIHSKEKQCYMNLVNATKQALWKDERYQYLTSCCSPLGIHWSVALEQLQSSPENPAPHSHRPHTHGKSSYEKKSVFTHNGSTQAKNTYHTSCIALMGMGVITAYWPGSFKLTRDTALYSISTYWTICISAFASISISVLVVKDRYMRGTWVN